VRVEKPIPRDKVGRLILLIAITFAVLSVVTLGPSRARLWQHHAPAQHPTEQPVQQVDPKH
jgi:hypothetical protein